LKIITGQITVLELKEMSEKMFGNLVKAVVDVEKEIIAVDGELHADEAELLVENGSRHENLWGINIYPEVDPPAGGEDWIEFDSMINLKPLIGNRTRGIDNPGIKEKVLKVVSKLVKR